MIFNLEDEKRRMRHHGSDDFSGGLSEEALLKLIEQVEGTEMLHAPVHLKENVLTQIRNEHRAGRQRQLFTYRARVLIAMAAALTMLVLMPFGGAEDAGGSFMQKQTYAVSMEQAALERRKEIDDNWERYREVRAIGGIRGLIGGIGGKITQFGDSLSWDRGGK